VKVDLHNHIVKLLNNKNLENFYLKIVKKHSLDAFAITNYHDIEGALRLKKKFPQHVIVGCEYRVFEDDAHLYIVVLDVTSQIHNLLMQARFRGLEYFTTLLKKNSLAYFWVRVGWGLPENPQKAAELIETFVPCFFHRNPMLACKIFDFLYT